MEKILNRVCKDALQLKNLDILNYSAKLTRIDLFSYINSNCIERLDLSHSSFNKIESSNLVMAIEKKWLRSLSELHLAWSNINKESLVNIINLFVNNRSFIRLKRLDLTGTCVETDMIK